MPSNIIVDCTWPCPGENNQACILSETSLKCQQKHNSQWVWTNPHLSPQYDGEPARVHQPCITVPLPHLPTTVYSSANSTQSYVEWPPTDKYQPMDTFLSDCNSANYCNQGTCVPKLQSGEACISTNQCLSGICNSDTQTCQRHTSSPPPSQQQQDQQQNNHQQSDQTKSDGVSDGPWSKPTFTTSHLVGVVVAVVVLLAAILLFYFYRRRKRAGRVVTTPSSRDNNNGNSNDINKLNSFIPGSLHDNASSPILPLSHIHNPSSSSTSSPPPPPPPPPRQQQSTLAPPPPQASLHSSSRSSTSTPSASASASASSSAPSTDTLHPHSSTDINTTPSMQQQQLQFQLQRQHPSLSHGSNTSPPPYSP